MTDKDEKSKINKEARELRRKAKRMEQSRDQIKAKSREKAKSIKAYQDRQTELKESRDEWKSKCQKQEKELVEVENAYKKAAELLAMKEDELRDMMKEFTDLKKKYPLKKQP